MEETTDPVEAEAFLKSLLDKTLRIYTTDGRIFIGTFKCTDTHSNVVLALTYEYREPSQQKVAEAKAQAFAGSDPDPDPDSGPGSGAEDKVALDMTSRYLGLVVVPGEHIVRMEVEEFVSQVKSRSILERRDIFGSR
ncbi:uncharacterized protein F4812DRAFT_463161 [Daldinia caldariorum]|uniref:uncharacterized protein n=1 Tax=Daldinia caldariorum TaxID=326644 RepID=UPI00200875E1|nr:uncharacterized protein F4812DRAFT_463161 [Daldinia caldariorum]KAI1464103.1 hypothetical protein F4812DRAFT_463161 [Daldinia caldariorum]